MSYVTTVTIVTRQYGKDLEKFIEKLNDWVRKNDHAGGLFELQDRTKSAGTKIPHNDVLLAGFNYLNREEFKEFFKSLKTSDTILIMWSEEEIYQIIPSTGTYMEVVG